MCDGNCDHCPIANAIEGPNSDVYPFQIHLTVETFDPLHSDINPYTAFFYYCKGMGILKPLMITNIKKNTKQRKSPGFGPDPDVMIEFITVTNITGTTEQAVEKLQNLKDRMIKDNWYLSRWKIETVPWHPSASHPKDASGQYFESHIKINGSDWDTDQLNMFAWNNGAHISFGKSRFFTLRDYDTNRQDFQKVVDNFVTKLDEQGIKHEKVIVEFAFFDSNPDLDAKWME